MYLWRANSIVISDADLGAKKSRYITTFQPVYEDARERIKQISLGAETIRSIDLIGRIPGTIGTSSRANPAVYYIVAAYQYPRDPVASATTRRIPTSFYESVDQSVASAFSPEYTIGPISTGPDEAVDVGKFGIIMSLLSENPEEVKRILIGQVFHGQITEHELRILNMTNLSALI